MSEHNNSSSVHTLDHVLERMFSGPLSWLEASGMFIFFVLVDTIVHHGFSLTESSASIGIIAGCWSAALLSWFIHSKTTIRIAVLMELTEMIVITGVLWLVLP